MEQPVQQKEDTIEVVIIYAPWCGWSNRFTRLEKMVGNQTITKKNNGYTVLVNYLSGKTRR